ncbi:MAG: hypothetical protein IT365_02160 [Candidatus Hydrogenedentes bacterium]|nr:hypothetical protein [Candidatus Hydrogenedentota bacterium]
MGTFRAVAVPLSILVVGALFQGCNTLQSVTNLANSIVSTAANTAVKAVSPSTYYDKNEEYSSRGKLDHKRGALNSRSTAVKSRSKSDHGTKKNPPIGMPYRSRYYQGD